MTNDSSSPDAGSAATGEESAAAGENADPEAPVDFTPGELDEPVDPDDDGHEVDG
jgi:hypothetical protein